MSVSVAHEYTAHKGQRRALDFPDLELEVIVNSTGGCSRKAGNIITEPSLQPSPATLA